MMWWSFSNNWPTMFRVLVYRAMKSNMELSPGIYARRKLNVMRMCVLENVIVEEMTRNNCTMEEKFTPML